MDNMKNFRNNDNNMLRDKRGMTMVELLVTVAIIMVLAGVAFVGVANYQRSLAQKERDGIAKEIFIAAQNHLTMAKGEGYLDLQSTIKKTETGLGETEVTVKGESEASDGIYHFVVDNGSAFTNEKKSILDLMLPFGSIDDTVRLGGSYIIRYHADTGDILDVFYCSTNGSPDSFNMNLSGVEYNSLLSLRGDENKSSRRNYGGSIIGWYGGTGTSHTPEKLNAPAIKVFNDDTLRVEITDTNSINMNAGLQLYIKGETSKAEKVVNIRASGVSEVGDVAAQQADGRIILPDVGLNVYTYIIDDITKPDGHFADLVSGTEFVAGEDIKIEAKAYSNTAFASIEYSGPEVTNSLYESIADPEKESGSVTQSDGLKLAFVSSIRHLENLSKSVSNTGYETSSTNTSSGSRQITIEKASQTDDLDWNAFKIKTEGESVFTLTVHSDNEDGNSSDEATSEPKGFYPLTFDDNYSLIYDGLRHSIRNVEIQFPAQAGLFGIVPSGSKIRNLELIDFKVTGGADTGALAGYANGAVISNVIAYNDTITTSDATVSSTGTSTGGLIGCANGCTFNYCGAALVVLGTEYAGGLVGEILGDTSSHIKACYSGGHTDKGEYYTHNQNGERVDELYNVTAWDEENGGGIAGGLVGGARGADIVDSYSTCSVNGKIVGGLAGNTSGIIRHCYSTGLVSGYIENEDNTSTSDVNNAFVGGGSHSIEYSVNSNTNSSYFSIINEYNDGSAVAYKGAGSENVKALDEDAAAYESFVGADTTWNAAVPYDKTSGSKTGLDTYYKNKYNLMTVTQLEAVRTEGTKAKISDSDDISNKGSLFVNTHHGDWPAPEIFIINQ